MFYKKFIKVTLLAMKIMYVYTYSRGEKSPMLFYLTKLSQRDARGSIRQEIAPSFEIYILNICLHTKNGAKFHFSSYNTHFLFFCFSYLH